MCKFFYFLILLFISISVSAQDLTKIKHTDDIKYAIDGWIYNVSQGDELTGDSSHENFIYIAEDMHHIVRFHRYRDGIQFFIQATEGIFDYNHYDIVFGNCGFYDKNGNLIEALHSVLQKDGSNEFAYSSTHKTGKTLIVQNNFSAKGFQNKRTQLINKIFDFLMNKDGFVRFVAPKYDGKQMDIKIKCLNYRI